MLYQVHAIDEFGRKYGNTRAFGQDIEDLKIEGVARVLMEKLIWDILKGMGNDAKAEWWGETRDISDWWEK